MKAWEEFLISLEKKIGTDVVEQWLRTLTVIDYDAGNLYLQARDTFQISWFKEHIHPLAKKSLRSNNGRPIAIHFSSKGKRLRKDLSKQHSSLIPFSISSDPLDPTMHLVNFITSAETSFVVNFFQNLQLGNCNPIFLYGPHGIGKTHLLHAVAHQMQKQDLSVFYVNAETFTEHVVKAIRSSQMPDFRQTYRNQDVLIIDDIHVFARRLATQEEFFHTFNALHTEGKQLIFSSHLPPGQLEDIEPRLVSRFEWGIVLQLHRLPPHELKTVLVNRSQTHNFPIDDVICEFLLEAFPHSSESPLRALDALFMRYKDKHSPPTREEAERLVEDLLLDEEKKQITPNKIITTTAAYYGIRSDDILGSSRSKECVMPRKIAMYLCRKELALSFLAIGRHFSRDHSTVMASVKAIQRGEKDEAIEDDLHQIEKLLK